MQAGKDLLDRYAKLSPKVHVAVYRPMKNPQTGARRQRFSRR